MALSYNVKMSDKNLSEEILIKKLHDMGYECKDVEKTKKGICIDFYDAFGFYMYLKDSASYPYNCWASDILGGDFLYQKVLEFRLNKEYDDLERRYNVILSIVFDLMLELKEEAIFISNDESELCMFKKNGEIYLNNKTEIWNRNYFKDIIENKNVHIIM